MSPKIVDKHQRKLDLVQASLTLFENNTIAKTSIAMIAKEAGLSKSSFYELFDNKTSLIIFITHSIMAPLDQNFETLRQADITAYEKITGFFIGSIEAILQGSVMNDVMFELWKLAYLEKEQVAIDTLDEFIQKYMTLLDDILKEGVQNQEFIEHNTMHSARAIGALIDGLQLQAILKGFDIIPTANHAISNYLKGIQSC